MNGGTGPDPAAARDEHAICFARTYLQSRHFRELCREGLALVEETANYLDGPGRRQAAGLTGEALRVYASESIRLTTRLMHLGSWLVMHLAVVEGEMDRQEAAERLARIRLETIARPGHVPGFDALPGDLKRLIEASYDIHDRVVKLARLLEQEGAAPGAKGNPVGAQWQRLQSAFRD